MGRARHFIEGEIEMTPGRCASEISKKISKIARAEKMPDPWTPSTFTSLIKEYRRLISAISPKTGAERGRSEEDKAREELLKNGQGYEAAQGLVGDK